MQNKMLLKTITIFSLLAVVFLFQNCQKFSPADISDSSGSVGVIPDPTPTPDPDPSPTPNPDPTPMPNPNPTPNNKIDVFLAQGHMGRTVMSCDDGQTWIRDRSENDNARCWMNTSPNDVECDHSAFAGRGIDSGDGWFFTNFGWGYDGSIRRSRDGLTWETVRTGGWANGLFYNQGVLFSLWNSGSVSNDIGQTWSNLSLRPTEGYSHPEAIRVNDKFLLNGRPSGNFIFGISYDQGATFLRPPTLQTDWLKNVVEGGNRMVAVGHTDDRAYSAVSLDNGMTWTTRQVPGNLRFINLVYTNQGFVTWADGKRFISTDGLNWTGNNVRVGNQNDSVVVEGTISHNINTGTYVWISDSWQNFYDKQKALRSSDGINWTRLPDTAFRGGHPIRFIVSGRLDRSACP